MKYVAEITQFLQVICHQNPVTLIKKNKNPKLVMTQHSNDMQMNIMGIVFNFGDIAHVEVWFIVVQKLWVCRIAGIFF